MARTARNVNVRLMGKIQQPPFKYTILFSETPKSYEKKQKTIAVDKESEENTCKQDRKE